MHLPNNGLNERWMGRSDEHGNKPKGPDQDGRLFTGCSLADCYMAMLVPI